MGQEFDEKKDAHLEEETPKMQENPSIYIIKPALIFCNNELYVSQGKNINVYNPVGGNLVKLLKGHCYNVVSLQRNRSSDDDFIISCDEKGYIFKWDNQERDENNEWFHLMPSVLEEDKVSHFSASQKFFLVTVRKEGCTSSHLHILHPPKEGSLKLRVNWEVRAGQGNVGCSFNEDIIAAISPDQKGLRIGNLKEIAENELRKYNSTKYHLVGTDDVQSFIFHPSKPSLATSHASGAIYLWHTLLATKPFKMKIHWHSLSLGGGLCFDPSGMELMSGGQETVLVKWELSNQYKKNFMARLGAPIEDIETDPTFSTLALLHNDHSISVVDPQEMKLLGLIQKTSIHVTSNWRNLLSAGLLYHPQTSALIKNGRVGYLQFFKPVTMKSLFNLDITMVNYVTKEHGKHTPNVEVTKAALSDDGLWMVTSEECQLTSSLKEIVIKFWSFDTTTQEWTLNTNAGLPHTDSVNCLTMRPSLPPLEGGTDAEPMCVSCSEDGKAKIWKLITYDDIHDKTRDHWNTHLYLEFHGLPVTTGNFAPDGSLFVAVFDSVITLWNPDDGCLRESLSQSFLKERILDVAFSKGSMGSLVSRSESYLCSWDLLSCSLLWRVFLQTTCLAVDKESGLMAVFSKDREVFLFEAHNSQPAAQSRDVAASDVACAIFIPRLEGDSGGRGDENSLPGHRGGILFYIDYNQNFFSLDPTSLNSKGELPTPDTPAGEGEDSELFSALVAKSRNVSDQHETPNEDEIESRVSLQAISINGLLKDLHNLHIHSMSFAGLVNHLESFLPSLSASQSTRAQDYNTPHYITIRENKEEEMNNHVEPFLDEEVALEALQKMDFDDFVRKIHS